MPRFRAARWPICSTGGSLMHRRRTLTLIVMPKCDQVEDECGEDPGQCSTSGAGEVERRCRGGEQQRSTEDECDSR